MRRKRIKLPKSRKKTPRKRALHGPYGLKAPKRRGRTL